MRRLALLLVFLCVPLFRLSAASVEDEVRAADEARVRATMHGDIDALAALLSEDLHYGHFDGRMQTKAQFVAAVRASSMKYEGYDYLAYVLTPMTADTAIINGRARFRVRTGENRREVTVQFLMVWKKEAGAWHLFSHQSSQLPANAIPWAGAPMAK